MRRKKDWGTFMKKTFSAATVNADPTMPSAHDQSKKATGSSPTHVSIGLIATPGGGSRRPRGEPGYLDDEERESVLSAPYLLREQSEPIPGYRLIEILGRGGFGEVWKCEAPGGIFKALKCVRGGDCSLSNCATAANLELEALQSVKILRHPFLLSIDRVEMVGSNLLIVSELADRSLLELLQEQRKKGSAGIPRAELLAYLREAAEALDWMSQVHRLQHLDIKPGNLLLVCNHVKVADFGLVQKFIDVPASAGQGRPLGTTPRYSAPETFQGEVSPHCDQYSLAIVFQELLTGRVPFEAKNARQVAFQQMTAPPNLSPLPAQDQPIVARALAKQAHERFPSCTEFIKALLEPPQIVAVSAPVAPPRNEKPSAVHEESSLDYQFLSCLGRNVIGEVWTVRATDGRQRVARTLPAPREPPGPQVEKILAALSSPGHPLLVPWEVAIRDSTRLVLVTDHWGKTLQQRYEECRAEGLQGIPRAELIGHLRGVAEALDHWAEHHQLLHLSLTPHVLQMHEDRLRVVDAGLMQILGSAPGRNLFQLNLRYAAPELVENQATPAVDQYALAVIYQEMLTGFLPHRSNLPRQLLTARRAGEADLDLLPAPDRPAIGRALHPDPSLRFASCRELLDALDQPQRRRPGRDPFAEEALPLVIPTAHPKSSLQELDTPLSPRQFVHELVTAAAGPLVVQAAHGLRFLSHKGEKLAFQCGVSLAPEQIKLKLESFCKQWRASPLGSGPEGTDWLIPQGGGRWQQWFGKPSGLRMRIRVQHTAGATARLLEMVVTLRPHECRPDQAENLLHETGPLLLQGLCELLQPVPEQRQGERLLFPLGVQVFPVTMEHTLGTVLGGKIKDVSAGGMGILTSEQPPSSRLYLQPVQFEKTGTAAILSNVVRVEQRTDGWFESGVRFQFSEGRRGRRR
jgi:serine/threonine protein kinase